MDFCYSLFGLCVRSNLPLPGAQGVHSPTTPNDVQLHLGISPRETTVLPSGPEQLTYASPESNAAGEPSLRILNVGQGEFVHLAYDDGTDFWVDRYREQVWATWTETSSLESTIPFLFGPVLGLLLRLRGVTCLHASAVAVGECSIAFVGTTGAGKSTTAAAFARQGFGVLSDDIAALSESESDFRVMPGYPHLCLWPASTKIFHDSAESLPRIVPEEEKRCLRLGNGVPRFECRPLPLGAIYFLGERQDDRGPYVEGMTAQAALLALVTETYANKILDRDLRAREFAMLSRLVETVPIRRVFPHRELSRVEELCKVVSNDFALQKIAARTKP